MTGTQLRWALAVVAAVAAVLVVGLVASSEPKRAAPAPISLGPGGAGPDQTGHAGVSATGTTQLRGAQTHPLWWDSTPEIFDRELDLLKGAGATAVRIDLSWSSLETDGKGKWSQWYVDKADLFLQHAHDRGLAVIGTLWSTPCWASSAPDTDKQGCTGAWWDRGVDRWAPTNPADFADAAAWVANRWGSKLAALEIWNEPNLPDQYSLRAPDPAAAYAGILKAAYPRVKAAAPDLPVLGGVLAFSDGDFLQRLYDLGIGGNFDGISIHPYNEWRDPDDEWKPEYRKYSFKAGVAWIHSIMSDHGDGDRGLWLTEFGFSTCGTGDTWCVTPDQQAEYVADSIRIAADWTYVKAAIVYNLRNKGTNPTGREDQFGLIQRDFSLKPAYAAFQAALAGAAVSDIVPDAPPSTGPAVPVGGVPRVPNPAGAEPLPFTVTFAKGLRTNGRKATVRVRCKPAASKRCRGRVEVRSRAGVLLAAGRIDARGGASLVKAKLTAAGRKAFAGSRRVTVVATVTAEHSLRIARATLSG